MCWAVTTLTVRRQLLVETGHWLAQPTGWVFQHRHDCRVSLGWGKKIVNLNPKKNYFNAIWWPLQYIVLWRYTYLHLPIQILDIIIMFQWEKWHELAEFKLLFLTIVTELCWNMDDTTASGECKLHWNYFCANSKF